MAGGTVAELLADDPRVVEVARLRWAEWGHEAGSTRLADWVDITRRECRPRGRARGTLPFTLTALDADQHVVGAVALVEHDPEGLPDRSPWVVGTVVDGTLRGRGVATALMAELARAAAGIEELWVSTQHAQDFYVACGYTALRDSSTVLCLRQPRP